MIMKKGFAGRYLQRTAALLCLPALLTISAAFALTAAFAQSANPPADAAVVDASVQVSSQTAEKIDSAVRGVLESTGVPSASIAIVENGRIAYLHAYGEARLSP